MSKWHTLRACIGCFVEENRLETFNGFWWDLKKLCFQMKSYIFVFCQSCDKNFCWWVNYTWWRQLIKVSFISIIFCVENGKSAEFHNTLFIHIIIVVLLLLLYNRKLGVIAKLQLNKQYFEHSKLNLKAFE